MRLQSRMAALRCHYCYRTHSQVFPYFHTQILLSSMCYNYTGRVQCGWNMIVDLATDLAGYSLSD